MEDKIGQHSFIFTILDKMTVQTKITAISKQRKVWQVKEMEEDYE